MGDRASRADGFDGAAAVTRSLLGYGVIAGPIYLAVGLTLALTRAGFALREHPLSLLMLGERGWMQRANIIVVGLMVVAAAVGYRRALAGTGQARPVGSLLAVFGGALVLSGIFPPDPMAGFPPGADAAGGSLTGGLHLAAGGVGFLALAGSALVLARWLDDRGLDGEARTARVSAAVVVIGFVAGGALATSVAGVAALWLAVVVGLGWLAAASVTVYRTVPHPESDRRLATAD
jgi:hypothetical protein